MDDTFRRQWAIQVAKERADEARVHARSVEVEAEVERRPLERSPWLGLQVRSLLALIAVAEEGSFIGAATRLGYSRSTISHQIAQLESAVGVSLLVRGSGYRSVTLTAAGRVVERHGRAVLRVLENAEAQVAEVSRQGRRRGLVPGLVRWDNGAPPPRPATS
jgi:molybdenum-dependent DNA-binding transcriptional regulator ModE